MSRNRWHRGQRLDDVPDEVEGHDRAHSDCPVDIGRQLPGSRREPGLRIFRANKLVADAVIALVIAGLSVATLVSRAEVLMSDDGSVRVHVPDTLGIVLLLVGTLVLGWRRHAPLLVLGVAAAAFFVYLAHGYAPTLLPFAPLISLYTTAAVCTAAISAAAATAMVAGFVVAGVTETGSVGDDVFLAFAISAVAAWMLGYGVQLQRIRTALLEHRATHSKREQAAKTEAAIELVRARIATELYDIVAHNVIAIVAQAAAAERVFDLSPVHVRQALDSIEVTGRQTLTEMRLLGVFRRYAGTEESHNTPPRIGRP